MGQLTIGTFHRRSYSGTEKGALVFPWQSAASCDLLIETGDYGEQTSRRGLNIRDGQFAILLVSFLFSFAFPHCMPNIAPVRRPSEGNLLMKHSKLNSLQRMRRIGLNF